MKRVILFAAAMLLLAGAGVAYTATSPSAKLAKQDRLWGGGQFGPGCDVATGTICITNSRNLSVDAHAESDGGQAVGNSAYAAFTSRTVTCLNVDGTHAVIGGQIEAGRADAVGAYYVQYFVDRGNTDASSQRDLASFMEFGSLTDTTFPVGFPYVCPPAEGSVDLPAFYYEMGAGDIVVQDSTTK
jgi:hypothetical protein